MLSRRRGGLALVLLGLLLIGICAAGFVHYARRDAATEAHGRRTTGTVVGLIQPRDWDLFDLGRIQVAFEGRTATVWLDTELSEYELGDEVTVIIRGDHVRTDRENNDPAPIGSLLVLTGLVGLGVSVWGSTRLLPPQVGVARRRDDGAVVLPLRTFRVAPRKAAMELAGGEVALYLPSFFGRRRLVVPTWKTGVHVLEEAPDDEPDDDEDVYFAEAIRIAEFPTAAAFASPNLSLVFTEPVRVPPLRPYLAFASNIELPFGVRESRSREGALVDGALVRAVDPEAAAAELVRHGATRVDDPLDFLAEHRRLVTDAAGRRAIDEEAGRERRAQRWSTAAYTAGFVCLGVAGVFDVLPAAVAGGVFLVAGFVLSRVLLRER